MGVHGLWKLIEPTGKVVPLESLAGKVLAVDVSIWLHQAVKGMQDSHGAPLAVAHLLVLFHRVCKLLFYKIKPVFVFDGGVPALKRQTMAARRQRSSVAKTEVLKVREKLIRNLLKHEALRHMLSNEAESVALGLNSFALPGPSVEEDLYKLPPIAADCVDSECSDALSSSDEDSEKCAGDIHSIDVTSQEFLSLPAEVRHDILTELIETRKQSSWKNLDNMPKKSDNFSDFQMTRLLKRHAVQMSLEKAGKEMGGRALSLKELESLLGDQGVLHPNVDLPSKRIAQDNVTRYMLVQKDSETKAVPKQKDGKQFDIMNHLEDVDWSSESDTDIILQSSPERQKELNKTSVPLNAWQQVEEARCQTPMKNRESVISSQPKVLVTQEVADILSVLEDKDVASDVKVRVENLQTKINFNKNSIDLKTGETKEAKYNESNYLPHLVEDSKSSFPESSDTNQLKISRVTVSTCAPDLEDEKLGKEKSENKVLDIIDGNKVEGVENEVDKVESVFKTSQKLLNSVANVEEMTDSSDSETDFIPVATQEVKNLETKINFNKNSIDLKTGEMKEAEDKNKNSDKSEVSTQKSDSLTVVVNPSEAGGDDLFVDIFDPVYHNETKFLGLNEVFGEDEGEKTSGSEIVNEPDLEFGEQVSAGDLNELKRTLEDQHSNYLKEKGKQERLALNMTDQIYSDAQELLKLFGIPFVVAPMEAEAQCATLNMIGLTEGTITDDSDIWLFGGLVVYKNFFNQQKHVLEYRSETIQKHFKLTREEMIKMALLVGSDYTVGLSGVGPVTALEIMAAFQTPKLPSRGLLDSLFKFRDWFTGASPGGPPRVTLRKKIKNAVITPGFPNKAVVEAYLHPQVDDSKEPFSWAKPNLNLICKYAKAKLGWSTNKCNELLLPVINKLRDDKNQTTIDKHFKVIQNSTVPDGMLSKRVENAIKRLGVEPMESEEPDVKPRKKRKTKIAAVSEENTEESSKPLITSAPCNRSNEFNEHLKNLTSRIKLINEKLHQNIKVPQRELAQKLLEEKKKEAVKIFRTYKKAGKKKTKVYVREQVKLSESSSEGD